MTVDAKLKRTAPVRSELEAKCVASRKGTTATLRVIQSLGEIEEIRPSWTTWRGHRDADIDVYKTLLACRSDDSEPHIVVVERNGRPDAILVGTSTTTTLRERIAYLNMPVQRVRVLNFVYGGFVGNASEENSKLVVHEIEQSLQHGAADIAVLSYVRRDTFLYHVATHVDSALMRDHFPDSQSHWMMDVPKTTDGIYAALSREHRKKLRAEAKKFRAAFPDLQIVRFHGTDRLQDLVRDTEQVAATTYQRGLSVGFSNTRPIRELLTLEAKKGWLRGYVLYVGNRPCAFWIGCVFNGAFLSEYLGHDPAYAKHSPGTYLLTQVMEELCREGVAAIDFGIGEALYKQRFGNRQWTESTVYLYAPTWTGMRVKALRTTAVLINSTAKRLLEQTNLAGRVKKLWRRRVTQDRSRTEVQ